MAALPIVSRCAVKRLERGGVRAEPQALLNELYVLGLCRHEHLLPLLGYCLEPSLHCLVFPLMEGGNLEDRLLPTAEGEARLRLLGFSEPPPPLSWH